jgi:hypothetical protein
LEPAGVLPFEYNFERVIDDFVFMCFFVGNDFLPHLPSLDIRDGAIDFLVDCYKNLLPFLGDYITSPGGIVNLRQVDVLLGRVGEVEDVVFQRRRAAEIQNERRQLQYAEQKKSQQQQQGSNSNSSGNGRGRSDSSQQHQQREYAPHPALLPQAQLSGPSPAVPRPPPPPPVTQSRPVPTKVQTKSQSLVEAKEAAIKKLPMKMIPLSNNKTAALTLREKILGKRSHTDSNTATDIVTTSSTAAVDVVSESAEMSVSDSIADSNTTFDASMDVSIVSSTVVAVSEEEVAVKKASIESTGGDWKSGGANCNVSFFADWQRCG